MVETATNGQALQPRVESRSQCCRRKHVPQGPQPAVGPPVDPPAGSPAASQHGLVNTLKLPGTGRGQVRTPARGEAVSPAQVCRPVWTARGSGLRGQQGVGRPADWECCPPRLGLWATETWPLDSRAAAPVGMEGLEPGATDPCRPERVRQRLAWATGFWCGSLWDWKLADRPARPSGGRPGTPSAEGLTGPWVKWESGWGGQGRGDR